LYGGYDIENRYVGSYGAFTYTYAPGNKRVWRQVTTNGTVTTDEVTFWSAGGTKLATYQLSMNGSQLVATQTGTYYWFGGKLIKNAGGYVAADRLGSIGHFYPYGQEKPSATQNGTEKFTGYFRDAETGLDYADQRYHDPGTGRFMTPDPSRKSADVTDPGTWNLYRYVGGDPVNRIDPTGRDFCDPFEDGYGLVPCESSDGGTIGGGAGCFTANSFGEVVSIDCNTLLLLNWAMYGTAAGRAAGSTSVPNVFDYAVYEECCAYRRIANHTYLDVTEVSASGQTLFNDVLEGGPQYPHNFLAHPKTSWGNLVGFVEPVPPPGTSIPPNRYFLGATNPNTNSAIGTDSGGDAVCAAISTLINAIGDYNSTGGVPYSLVPRGTSRNSNSFTFTLLNDIGLSSTFSPYVFNSPGWGLLVPGLN
jgi:RHS repeat-associated protein